MPHPLEFGATTVIQSCSDIDRSIGWWRRLKLAHEVVVADHVEDERPHPVDEGRALYGRRMGYSRGQDVAIRDIHGGAILFAWPMTVVEDGGRGLLVSEVPGAIGKVTRGYPNDPAVLLDELFSGRPALVDLAWTMTTTLGVYWPDVWWSTRLMWDATSGALLCYYVDFRRPIRRNGSCVDTLDLGLDIVVAPDGSWTWKDEEQLPLIRSAGWFGADEETDLTNAREDAVAAIERQAFPFDGSLLSMQPGTDLVPAVLPDDWDARLTESD